MTRALIICGALLLVGAHLTGNMKSLTAMFDIGIDTQSLLYVAGLPLTCIMAFFMLRD